MTKRPFRTLLLLLLAVLLAPASPALAQDPPAVPKLTASLDPVKARPTLVVPFGTSAKLSGRLVDGAGNSLGGVELQLTSRALMANAKDVAAGTLVTGPDGRFAVALIVGPSRRVTITYRRAPTDPEPAATAKVTVIVRAGVNLRATPSSLRNGQTLRLRGELRGKPFPAVGKFVDLQVRRNKRWLTFASIRALKGRFAYDYRFKNTTRKRTLLFRVQVPAFSTYPYARGVSSVRSVTVRPRAKNGS